MSQTPPLRFERGVLIYNPVAGRNPARGKTRIDAAAALLNQQGIRLQVVPTTGPASARQLAREAVEQGTNLILVCGGDGTINEVVNGMAGSRVPLGVLPGGTANVLAHELRLPRSPERVARTLLAWEPRRIALGCVRWPDPQQEQRYFLSLAGIGFDAYIIRHLSETFKRNWGKLAYTAEAVRQWWRFDYRAFDCRFDGRTLKPTFAVVARTRRYAGSFRLAPKADLFGDYFIACIFYGAGRLNYLKYVAGLATGLLSAYKDVELTRTQRLEFSLPPGAEEQTRPYIEVDGELTGRLPAKIEIVPDALTLLVPPGTDGG